jgi:hypothetical protein
MPETIFSDGVADVTVIGGVVRIEFFTLIREPGAQKRSPGGEAPPMQRRHEVTIAMPIPAFSGSFNVLEEVRKALLSEGVIQSTAERPASTVHGPAKKSPNFS